MRHAQHTNNFDLIRLLAALQVLYGHSAGWLKLPPLPAPTSYAVARFPGVAVFFVISGFLVTRSFLESRSGIAGYFSRRALRIYPGWLLSASGVVGLAHATRPATRALSRALPRRRALWTN